MMEVNANGVWAEVVAGECLVGGVWRTIVKAEIYNGTVWKEVATFTTPITATIDNNPAYTIGAYGELVATSPISVVVTGGIAPFTYSWSRTSGSSTISNASSASVTFTKTVVGYSAETWTVTITDKIGATKSETVELVFEPII